jgi:hypothetical protein
MSLVIALVGQDRLHLCADLRVVKSDILTDDRQRHSPDYFNGVLKIIPVSSSVAICYAGTVSIALDAIRAVKDSGCTSDVAAELIISRLRESNSLEECDFLVVDAAKLLVQKIQNGSVSIIDTGRTWIGDADAYNLFQSKLNELGYSEDENTIAKSVKIMNSLQSVINDRSINSVGEYPITAHSSNGEIHLGVAFSAQGPSRPLNSELNPVHFSNDTNDDSLIINLTVPIESGVAAVGIFITQAHSGALYAPLIQDAAYIINGYTIGEFRRNVLNDYGIEMLGGGFE